MSELVILTEAGGSAGFGHLTRCRAIADATGGELRVQGHGAYPKDSGIREQAWMDNAEELVRELPATSQILVDSYLATIEIYVVLSRRFHRLAVIDDYDRLNYPVSLLINPGPKLPPYCEQIATVVGGSEYITLRNAVRCQPPKTDYERMENVLVTFGGSDNRNMLDWLVPVLVNRALTLTIVVGDDFERNRLASVYPNPAFTWLGPVGADHMARLMAHSDLALSAGGQTLHELAFLGVPTVGVQTGKDQLWNIEGYVAAGFLLAHLHAESRDFGPRTIELLHAYRDPAVRRNAGMAGRRLVDGHGALRIAELLRSQRGR